MKVRKRDGFSDRNNIKKENSEIQLTSLDERSRNSLFNLFDRLFDSIFDARIFSVESDKVQFIRFVFEEIYVEPANDYEYRFREDECFNEIRKTILKDEYDDVLTLIEAISQWMDWKIVERTGRNYIASKTTIFDLFNSVFEREFIGYRFVDKVIVRITDEIETNAINDAILVAADIVKTHLEKALRLLANRENPDYSNSIKESISAVEAQCTIIVGSKCVLGKALSKLESSGVEIHGALKEAYSSLYGYTSDANGIRHAGNIGGPKATFEEAKYMLVSCCAFVNYLIGVKSRISN